MKEYLLAVVAAAVITSLSLALSHSATRGAVSVALGVLLLSFILTPLADFALNLDLPSVIKPDFSYSADDSFDRACAEAFERGISEHLSEKYGHTGGIQVDVTGFSVTDMRADRICVTVGRDGVLADYREIREYIEENFTRGGTCEIEYGTD